MLMAAKHKLEKNVEYPFEKIAVKYEILYSQSLGKANY
jgi:hypothetical protein